MGFQFRKNYLPYNDIPSQIGKHMTPKTPGQLAAFIVIVLLTIIGIVGTFRMITGKK